MHCTCPQRERKLCYIVDAMFDFLMKTEGAHLLTEPGYLIVPMLFVVTSFVIFTCIRVIKFYIDCGNVVINYQCFKISVYLFIGLSWISGLSVSVIGGSVLPCYSTHLAYYHCGSKMGHFWRKHKNLVWDSQSTYYFLILILAFLFFRIIINFIHANFVEHI